MTFQEGRDRRSFPAGGEKRDPLHDFKRNSWFPKIPVTSVWYADPTLYTGELSLYWYYGTNRQWHLENIAFLLAYICKRQDLSLQNSLFFGSSGGGYSSLVLASLLHGKATVINPQVRLSNYYPEHYQVFLRDVLQEGEEILQEREDIVSLFQRERFIPRIHYVQNLQARRDIRLQVTPFLREISDRQLNCGSVITMEYYFADGGHNAMPGKEKSLSLIRAGLSDPGRGVPLDATNPSDTPTFWDRLSYLDLLQDKAYYCIDAPQDLSKAICQVETKLSDGFLYYNVKFAFPPTPSYSFAYYLQSGQRVLEKKAYSSETAGRFRLSGPGSYLIKCFVVCGGEKQVFRSDTIAVRESDCS